MARLRRFAAVSAAAALALAGFASLGSAASEHQVKLTGVVAGTVACTSEGLPANCTKISIHKGKMAGNKVGKWTLGPFSCAGIGPRNVCVAYGHGKMQIGDLNGKVALQVKCRRTTRTGKLTQPAKPAEHISFATCPGGMTKGDAYKFTLTY